MADKLSVQNALTQLLKENKNILKNGRTLIDALFERADMSFVDRKIYEKAFVDANIGEIFLIETIETANEQAYSKLKRIMQERIALDVLETLSTALHNANNSKQGEDAAETGTNGKQGTDGGQNDGQDGGNGHDEVLKDMDPPHPPPVLTPNDYYNNGVKAIGEEKFSEAMAAFNKAIELSPTHEKAYGMRAMLHAKNGEYNDAIADYGKVISYNSNNSSAYRNRGMCYYVNLMKSMKIELSFIIKRRIFCEP
ncbi:MAG: hypothetical protein J6O04_06740 [Selenomonadaceae bacterium]|nr:hypothetical protein [Selenomonadaceae bacterium]